MGGFPSCLKIVRIVKGEFWLTLFVVVSPLFFVFKRRKQVRFFILHGLEHLLPAVLLWQRGSVSARYDLAWHVAVALLNDVWLILHHAVALRMTRVHLLASLRLHLMIVGLNTELGALGHGWVPLVVLLGKRGSHLGRAINRLIILIKQS